MQVGMIGLGRMGANMARRLIRGGHECVVHDISADAVRVLGNEGASGATSIEDFIARLATPRVVWLTVPANVLAAALFGRFGSRGGAEFQDRLLSVMRFEVGGRVEKAADK